MVAVETSSLVEWVFRIVAMPAVFQFFPGLCPVPVLGNGPVNGPGGRIGIVTGWGGVGWVICGVIDRRGWID